MRKGANQERVPAWTEAPIRRSVLFLACFSGSETCKLCLSGDEPWARAHGFENVSSWSRNAWVPLLVVTMEVTRTVLASEARVEQVSRLPEFWVFQTFIVNRGKEKCRR